MFQRAQLLAMSVLLWGGVTLLVGCGSNEAPTASDQTTQQTQTAASSQADLEAASKTVSESTVEQQRINGCVPELAPATIYIKRIVSELRLDGAGLLLKQGGLTLCESYFGKYTENTTVPLISAAKWISAAAILRLVDEGFFALDEPVSKYLKYFEGERGTVTLRQMLSHTSGLPVYHECMFQPEILLDACTHAIAEAEMVAAPGTQFNYSGAPYSVAGRMAEAAVGGKKRWNDIFLEKFAEPLGLRRTHYGNTRNPMLSEGWVVSSLTDYGAVLQMILNGGVHDEKRILSEAAIQEMIANQTAGVALGFSPRGPSSYGLGVWRDRVDDQDRAVVVSSPGGAGFTPWISFERNQLGVFMVETRNPAIWTMLGELQSILAQGLEKLDL